MNRNSVRTPLARPLSLVLASAAALLAVTVPAAPAADPTAELRVEGPAGKIDPGTWYVLPKGKVAAPLAKAAGNCAVRAESKRGSYPQRSALGLALNGAALNPDLRGARVQPFDFGPLLCRYAGIVGEAFDPATGSFSGWNYYVDFAGGSSSADLAEIGNGDRVLWAFADESTTGTLRLGEPVAQGDSVTVRVDAFGFDGQPTRVDDATIEGAQSQTSLGEGRYSIELENGTSELVATRGEDIDSNLVRACSDAGGTDCPDAFGRTIVGTERADLIATTPGDDVVRAGAGDDTVRAASGGIDRVNCGAGAKDVVIVERGEDDVRSSNCERVRRVRGD